MNRFVTFVLLLAQCHLSAQITWVDGCADKSFCFNPGSCTEGNVFIAEEAVSECFGLVNISYRIDLFNNGNTDIVSDSDTVTGAFAEGTHKITWKATDNCFNISNCTYLFTITDCQGPNVVCLSNISQNMEPGCITTLHAANFVSFATDNCTPSDELQFGIRRAGTGTGFPNQASIPFSGCDDLGESDLEIWVKDESGFTNQCNSGVTVDDNGDFCGCVFAADIGLQGCGHTASGTQLDHYTMESDLYSTNNLDLQQFTSDSCYNAVFAQLPLTDDYQVVVRASRNDDPLAGVSTFDLLQTSRHILGLQPFQNLYQRIAADVNANNSVTTFDIVETRKLILGIYAAFPAVPSWRFIRPLADPENFASAVRDTYQITVTNLLTDTTLTGLDFVGIKMGDTNLSASFSSDDTDDRSPLFWTVEDRLLNTGEEAFIPIRVTQDIMLNGWQLAVEVDPALAQIEGVEGLPEECFALSPNTVRALWYDANGKQFFSNEAVLYLKIKVLQPVLLSHTLSFSNEELAAEAYIATGKQAVRRSPLILQFGAAGQKEVVFFPPRPNPFSDETNFGLLLHQPSKVRMELFDVSGKKVFEKNMEMAAGYQAVSLSAATLPPGAKVLFYRIQAEDSVFSGRLLRK